MPRGVPKNGFRKTKNWKNRDKSKLEVFAVPSGTSNETDEQISLRLSERFDILSTLTNSAISGEARALIVSGPAGLGKSFQIERALSEWDPSAINHTIVKGYVRPTGLYRILHQFKEAGQVIVFDDADSIFFDDVSLNLLKSVCDTTERRVVSYLSEAKLDDDEGERLPKSFEFNGTIIFITNLDFDTLIERGHKLTPHLQALVSRSHYIDLSMKTRRDYLVRIRQVLDAGMLQERGLTKKHEADVVDFLEANQTRLRELSLRMALKIGSIRKMDQANWSKVAMVTCCRN